MSLPLAMSCAAHRYIHKSSIRPSPSFLSHVTGLDVVRFVEFNLHSSIQDFKLKMPTQLNMATDSKSNSNLGFNNAKLYFNLKGMTVIRNVAFQTWIHGLLPCLKPRLLLNGSKRPLPIQTRLLTFISLNLHRRISFSGIPNSVIVA